MSQKERHRSSFRANKPRSTQSMGTYNHYENNNKWMSSNVLFVSFEFHIEINQHHLSVIPAWDPNYPVVDWGPAPCVLNLQKTIFFSNAHSWHGTATGDDDGHYNISQNICFERGALAGWLAESNQYSEWSRSIQVPAKLTTSSVTLTLKCVSAGDRNSHRSNAVNSNGNALKMRRAWRFRSQACLLLLTHEK